MIQSPSSKSQAGPYTHSTVLLVLHFRGSWAKACEEAGLPGLHFHDLRRTAARNMRRGHVAEKVAMEIGGWKTTSVFHRYAIVDNQDIANAMEMLERSQDEQRQRLEALATKAERPLANNVGSQKSAHQSTTLARSEKSALTSRLRYVEGSAGVSGRLHRGVKPPRVEARRILRASPEDSGLLRTSGSSITGRRCLRANRVPRFPSTLSKSLPVGWDAGSVVGGRIVSAGWKGRQNIQGIS
jgi:Phage integrase family